LGVGDGTLDRLVVPVRLGKNVLAFAGSLGSKSDPQLEQLLE